MLKVLDLFSGIGSFSYALHDILETIAYCEINEHCRAILGRNMIKGYIHTAPIFNDVKTFNRVVFDKHIDVIVAGFPCQDISTANSTGQGLNGARSGLFWEIMRIVDEFSSVSHIMLENSPNLLNRGYDAVKNALVERGFTVTYVLLSAADVGAPHTRKRIFIWASRHNIQLPVCNVFPLIWGPPPERIILSTREDKKAYRKRYCACGNSIVPHCIQIAFNTLVHNSPFEQTRVEFPITLVDREVVYRKQLWATPSAQEKHYYAYKTLTHRSTGVLFNQVMYEQSTVMIEHGTLNPNYIEWMMGFPLDFTL